MSFRFKNLPKFISDLLDAVEETVSPPKLLAVGSTAREIIKSRTESGKNPSGGAFKGYSTKRIYISKRDRPAPRGGAKTRGGKTMRFDGGYRQYKSNLYGATPNMTKSGAMLRGLKYQASGKKITIGIYDAALLGRAWGTDETRHWLDIGKIASEREAIQAAWRRANGV